MSEPTRERELNKGDFLLANPCEVVVTSLGDGRVGSAWCYRCKDYHVLDVRLYKAGRGPWKRD